VGHWPRVRRRRWLTAALAPAGCVLLVGAGLLDQVPPVQPPRFQADVVTWKSDQSYVDQIQARVAANTMVFQLPYQSFPESAGVLKLVGSDPLRPYLHSSDLRWSYGGIKGRALADWAESVSSEPTERMLVEIVSSDDRRPWSGAVLAPAWGWAMTSPPYDLVLTTVRMKERHV